MEGKAREEFELWLREKHNKNHLFVTDDAERIYLSDTLYTDRRY